MTLDFFAGSGTTLHAVNLLNAEDGGSRHCIMVTNNEVSSDEAQTLSEQGFKTGDEEWEKFGIARYVCWPRTVCSIMGHDINDKPLTGDYGSEMEFYEPDEDVSLISKASGKPIRKTVYRKAKKQLYPKLTQFAKADGLKANAIFFKLSFLDKTSIELGEQLKALVPLLWMKAGSIGNARKSLKLRIFTSFRKTDSQSCLMSGISWIFVAR